MLPPQLWATMPGQPRWRTCKSGGRLDLQAPVHGQLDGGSLHGLRGQSQQHHHLRRPRRGAGQGEFDIQTSVAGASQSPASDAGEKAAAGAGCQAVGRASEQPGAPALRAGSCPPENCTPLLGYNSNAVARSEPRPPNQGAGPPPRACRCGAAPVLALTPAVETTQARETQPRGRGDRAARSLARSFTRESPRPPCTP